MGSVQAAVQTYRDLPTRHGHTEMRSMCSYFTNVVSNQTDMMRTKERLLYYLHCFLPAVPQDRAKAPPHIAYFVEIARS